MIAIGSATLKVKAKSMDEAARIALDQAGDLECGACEYTRVDTYKLEERCSA